MITPKNKRVARNRRLYEFWREHQGWGIAAVGRMFHLKTRQRAHQIIKEQAAIKRCVNCYHFQEFKHCSCRDVVDVIELDNKCPWYQESLPDDFGRHSQ